MTLEQLKQLLPKLEIYCFCSPTNNENIWSNPEQNKGEIHCIVYNKKGENKPFCHLVTLLGHNLEKTAYTRMGFPSFQSNLTA